MMFSLGMLLQSKLLGTASVWCIRCKDTQTVIKKKVVEGRSAKSGYRRLIGQCMECRGATSTFLHS